MSGNAVFDVQIVQLSTGAVAWPVGVNASYSVSKERDAALFERVNKIYSNKHVQNFANLLGLKEEGDTAQVVFYLRYDKNVTVKNIYKGALTKMDAVLKIYRTTGEEPGKNVVEGIKANGNYPAYLLGSLKPAYRGATARPAVGFPLTCRMDIKLAQELAQLLADDGCKVEVYGEGDTSKPVLVLNPPVSEKEVAAAVSKPAKEIDPGYFVWETQAKMVVDALVNRYNGGYTGKTSVMFGGPSGYGKTTAAIKLAELLKMDIHIADMSLYTEPEDVFGLRQVVNGTTSFVPTKLAQAIAKGNCVVVLDEINRAFPMVLNGLFGILDDRNMNHVRGVDVKVGERVIFVATRNLGAGFVGTMASDAALINRFKMFVDFGNLSAAQEIKMLTHRLGMDEAVAAKLVSLWTTVRQSVEGVFPSPRTSQAVWDGMQSGLTIRQAIHFSLIMGVSDIDTRRQLEDAVNRVFGTF